MVSKKHSWPSEIVILTANIYYSRRTYYSKVLKGRGALMGSGGHGCQLPIECFASGINTGGPFLSNKLPTGAKLFCLGTFFEPKISGLLLLGGHRHIGLSWLTAVPRTWQLNCRLSGQMATTHHMPSRQAGPVEFSAPGWHDIHWAVAQGTFLKASWGSHVSHPVMMCKIWAAQVAGIALSCSLGIAELSF